MKAYQQFIFESYRFDAASRTAEFCYSLDGEVKFTDKVVFGFEVITDYDAAVLDRVLRGLWLMSGVSYIKTALPPTIEVKGIKLSRAEAEFFSRTYRLGLGQLCYENQLSLDRVAKFPVGDTTIKALDYAGEGDLVAFGGGKDSLVSTAILQAGGVDFATFSATYIPTSNTVLEDLAAMVGQPHLSIHREFDPSLREFNAAGAYNGHIPVTAVISFIGLAAAVLTGRRRVIFSNEASAGEGNVTYEGEQINHQYSKTLEFEKALQGYIHGQISPSLECFSLLRPLGELRISELFARSLFGKYAGHFSSCNRNFRHGEMTLSWCGECPKCAFVFLILAPFIAKPKLVAMFGDDLLGKPGLTATYEELLGLSGHKPFECVGEIEECRAALWLVRQTGDYKAAERFDVPKTTFDYHQMHPASMPDDYRSYLQDYLDREATA